MNVSHEWLGAFVPHGLPAERVRDLITAHVATVEGFERTRAELAPFVVGQVVASERIPDTRLSFNKVDDGTGTLLEVVCGAPNVTVGAKYPFARTGTTMPAGFVIEKKKIRGFTSNGMLCSARELGLGDDHDGIYALDTEAPVGTPLLSVLPLADTRLVLDVLPNRPDLLSHLGVARELAALTGTTVRLPEELPAAAAVTPVRGAASASAGGVRVTLADSADCGRYCAVIIRGLKVGPSPDWLRRRVESVGGRSINNVVDATNYLLHGFGQPVHAFDLATLGGGAIGVRRAAAGESLTTLDGAARTLDASVLVIADASVPVALAGLMGGKATEVTECTTDVLLEVATFAPRVVRGGRRKLGMSTDASYRYERGIDDAAVESNARIAAALIVAVAGGEVAAMASVGTDPAARASVAVAATKVSRLLGDAVGPEESAALLRAIGFATTVDGDRVTATPPSWRHDVARDVDLVEDIARLRGFDRLPDALTAARLGTVPDHPLYTLGVRVRNALVADGLLEVRPLPYRAGAERPLVRVRNPLGEDEPFLRDSILDTLARRAEHNLARMQGNVRIFEIGTAFLPGDGASVKEAIHVGALVMGARRPPHFTESEPPAFDAWDAKALAERMVHAAWPASRVELKPAEAPALWSALVDGTARGVVTPVALDAPVWASAAFGVELTLGKMPARPPAARGAHEYERTGGADRSTTPARYVPLPTTPAAEFDLALVVPDAVSAAAVEKTLRGVSGEMLESLLLFDEYRGDKVPAGTRSLAWRLTFRHPERTLRDKEIEGRRAQLLKTLEKELNVRARTT
ncbi:MAG: phenylalanine--tRNA ligase subunit beta [Gemmatimonadetes bacterium]|nr:phenylalanine--tRNA ligase subunit beta [Gemmatimonadota bacterium]